MTKQKSQEYAININSEWIQQFGNRGWSESFEKQ